MRDDALQINVDSVVAVTPVVKSITLTPERANYATPYMDIVREYQEEGGVPLYFLINNKPMPIGHFKVSLNILQDERLANRLTVA
jgi:hypothetical protein